MGRVGAVGSFGLQGNRGQQGITVGRKLTCCEIENVQ